MNHPPAKPTDSLAGAELGAVLTPSFVLQVALEILERAGVDLTELTHEERVQLTRVALQGITITSYSYSPKRRAYQLALKGAAGSWTMHMPARHLNPEWRNGA